MDWIEKQLQRRSHVHKSRHIPGWPQGKSILKPIELSVSQLGGSRVVTARPPGSKARGDAQFSFLVASLFLVVRPGTPNGVLAPSRWSAFWSRGGKHSTHTQLTDLGRGECCVFFQSLDASFEADRGTNKSFGDPPATKALKAASESTHPPTHPPTQTHTHTRTHAHTHT